VPLLFISWTTSKWAPVLRRPGRERRRVEAIRRTAQGRGESAARDRSAAQTLGRPLCAEVAGVLVGEDERVARIAGEHR
jgi:ATP-dependent exoDNAse (exonuclease V) alpha subunit